MTCFLGLEVIVIGPQPIDRDTNTALRPIPMTREVFDRLESEVARLTHTLPALQDAALMARGDDDDAALVVPAAWELQRHAQRLEALQRLLSAAEVVPQDGMAILGS